MRDRVLDVGPHEAVGIDAPLFERDRADDLGREPWLGLPCLLGREPPVGMRLLERLVAVVYLDRSLHSLDVVVVAGQHRDEEWQAVDHVSGDRHDVTGVETRQPRGVPVELEVTEAAVDHPARGATRPRAPIAFLHQQDRKSAQ